MGTSTRKVEIYCGGGEYSGVEEWLSEEGLYWYRETVRLRGEEPLCRITVYAPIHALPRIYAGVSTRLDLRRRENSIIVIDAEAAVGAPHRVTSRRYRVLALRPRLKPRFMLRQEAEELSVLTPGMLILASVASLVALAGLVADNPYVVLGAMLISPVLAPIYAFSAAVVAGTRRTVARSFVTLLTLLLAAALVSLTAAGTAALLGHGLELTRELLSRAEVSALTPIVAFLLGGAAMLGPSLGAQEALIGVAIAAAIIPPAAALGWSLAVMPGLAPGILANLGINVAGLLAGGVLTSVVLSPDV